LMAWAWFNNNRRLHLPSLEHRTGHNTGFLQMLPTMVKSFRLLTLCHKDKVQKKQDGIEQRCTSCAQRTVCDDVCCCAVRGMERPGM
jgi:hypothetical protein